MQGFSKLYAHFLSFQRAARNRIALQAKTAETSASPLLVYAATVLLMVLAMLEVDIHQEELKALGLIGGERNGAFLGP